MRFSSLEHVFPRTAKINSLGHLEIAGVDTLELAEEFGTPLYLFCEESLRQQCRTFIEEFRGLHRQTDVAYAAKAYLGPALAKLLQEEGLGLDVVSGGELAVAEAVNFPAERIYFHGNNKSPEELERALAYGVGYIVVDNLHELRILEGLAKDQNRQQSILIRVTPGVDAHTHVHTTTGTLDSKFGLPLATGQAEEALRMALASRYLILKGLHFHLGSPLFELEPYATAIDIVLAFAARFREEGLQLQEFSPGGGFAIAYTRDQQPPSVAEYAETIVSAIRQGCDSYGLSMPRIVVEPGRAIVGPAGVALYTVGAIKEIPGVRTFASVDGGMGDNIRPALYDAQYEVVVAGRVEEEPTMLVTIAGKYCESGDILVRNANLPSLIPGDLLAIPASGAYAPAMASNYNMNPRPAMVMLKDGHARLIRQRGTLEGMLKDDIW
jgi:diaminopimelate decarboxylase